MGNVQSTITTPIPLQSTITNPILVPRQLRRKKETVHHPIGHYVTAVLMIILCACAREVSKTASTPVLANGKYDLRLLVPDMAKGKEDVTLPAVIKLDKETLTLEIRGMLGNKMTLKGFVRNGKIKFGMTEAERDDMISYHYVGKVENDKKAQGKLICIMNGEVGFDGTWILSKKAGLL